MTAAMTGGNDPRRLPIKSRIAPVSLRVAAWLLAEQAKARSRNCQLLNGPDAS